MKTGLLLNPNSSASSDATFLLTLDIRAMFRERLAP
jgi:hypothetical protein